jgi:hypothetical protein
MPTPIVHRKNPRFVKTYDYVETATGVGYLRVYLSDFGDGTYSFSTTPTDSHNKLQTHQGGDQAQASKELDLDFDIKTAESFIIEGTAKTQCTYRQVGTTNKQTTQYHVIKIRKYDGTTETDIATITTSSLVTNNSNGHDLYRRDQSQAAATTTFVAATDTLRITVEVWMRGDPNDGTQGTATIYYDPTNRTPVDTDNKSTTYEVFIPIKTE